MTHLNPPAQHAYKILGVMGLMISKLTKGIGEAQLIQQLFMSVRILIHACKHYFIHFHRGGFYSNCSLGYKGLLCDICIGEHEGKVYVRSGDYACLECQPLSL